MLALLLLACSGGPETAGSPPAPSPTAEAPGPNIVLITVDTLRADHLGAYGYDRATSPAMDRLAARGVRFHRAYAQSGWTLASFTSMMTGLYPHEHRVGRDPYDPTRFGRLPAEATTLAEHLQAKGYRTAAIINNTFLAPEFGLHQGFDSYDFFGATNEQNRSATDSVACGLTWLGASEQPALLWLHIMEPHLDYVPPEKVGDTVVRGTFAKGPLPDSINSQKLGLNVFSAMQTGRVKPDEAGKAYTVGLYDEEILGTDVALAGLFDAFDAQGTWEDSLVILTSDHGEEFWDHGAFEHGHALYGESTRVPLIAAGPGIAPGIEAKAVVEHVDLFQGILAVAGAASPEGSHGEDLFALAATTPNAAGRASLSENCLYGPPCVSLVDDNHRLVLNQASGAGEVWAVAADGTELERLQGESQLQAGRELMARLEAMRGSLDPISAVAGPEVPSYETFSQLAALGYLDDVAPEDVPGGIPPAAPPAPDADTCRLD